MKKWGVIIENITILKEPVGPAPYDMKMLGFIRIKMIIQYQ